MCDGFRENQEMHCLWKCPGASPEGEADLATEVRFNGARRWLHMIMLLHDRLIGNAVGGCWYSLQWSDPVRRLQEWLGQHLRIKSATHSFTLRLVGVQRRDCLDFSHSSVILCASWLQGAGNEVVDQRAVQSIPHGKLLDHKQHLLLVTFATEVVAMCQGWSRKGECPKPYHWQWPRLVIHFVQHLLFDPKRWEFVICGLILWSRNGTRICVAVSHDLCFSQKTSPWRFVSM